MRRALRPVFGVGKTLAGASLALGLGWMATSCGDDESTGTRTAASPQLVELLEAVCDLSFRCCTQEEAGYYLGPFVDSASCVERLSEAATLSPQASVDLAALAGLGDFTIIVPNLAAADEAVLDLRMAVRPSGVDACIAHIQELGCNLPAPDEDDQCVPPEPPAEENPCHARNMFVGLLQGGEVCTSSTQSLECKEGYTCGQGFGTGIEGRCVKARRSGETCLSDFECDDGLYCSPLDGTCQSPRNEGEVCVFADRDDPAPPLETLLLRCRDDLSCDPITNTCVAACQRGAKCVSDADCDDAQELSCIVGRCDLPRSAGLPCIEDDDCADSLRCIPDPLDPTALACSEGKPVGASCVDGFECATTFCNPQTFLCAAQKPAGSVCESGLSAECMAGACVEENPGTFCSSAAECPLSGVCDPVTSQCANYCVPAKPDGTACVLDSECISDDCIAGICRTPPLGNGEPCEIATQCDSDFCSYEDEPTCLELPLSLGARCLSNAECDSGVCFAPAAGGEPTCTTGLDEGELCADPLLPPCNPKRFYCDTAETDPPACVPLKETGEVCRSAVECRGDCSLAYGRLLCSPAAAEDAAVCDGVP